MNKHAMSPPIHTLAFIKPLMVGLRWKKLVNWGTAMTPAITIESYPIDVDVTAVVNTTNDKRAFRDLGMNRGV